MIDLRSIFLRKVSPLKLTSIEEAWRALGQYATRQPRLYVLSPGSAEAGQLGAELERLETSLLENLSAREIERAYGRLQDVVETHAAGQQRQVDTLIGDLSDAIHTLASKISFSSEEQEYVLDDLQSIETSIRRANEADSLEDVRQHLAAGIETVSRVVEKQAQIQDHLRLESERATAMLARKLLQSEAEGRVDTLTRVGNRIAFEYYGQAIQSKVNIGEGPYTLVAIDLDGFKALNDKFGHQAGDEALRVFVDRLRASIGERAFIGRVGGDEFSAIIPFSESKAVMRITRLLRGLERCPVWLKVNERSIETHLSFSFGCVELTEQKSLKQSAHAADLIMYDHKRNRKSDLRVA